MGVIFPRELRLGLGCGAGASPLHDLHGPLPCVPHVPPPPSSLRLGAPWGWLWELAHDLVR